MYSFNYSGQSFTKGFLVCSTFALAISGSLNAEARTRYSSALAVKSQPSSTTIYEGQSTTFSISATSSKTITYTWYKDGVTVGSNSKSLSISGAATSNAGTYSCKVTDGTTTYNCTSFSLTVNQIVRITSQPSNQIVNEGSASSMSVAATGTAPISYQWYYAGQALSGATSKTLAFSSTAMANAGSYYCVVSNPGSNATSSTATLSVLAKVTTGTASLSWSAPTVRQDGTALAATDIAGYNLYESDTDATSLVKIVALSASDLSYVVTGLTSGTHYFAATTVDINGIESVLPTPSSVTIP